MDSYYEKEFDEIYVKDCFHETDINEEDIMDYFVFDEDENNIIDNGDIIKNNNLNENKSNKEIKVNYNVCSYFTSPIRPDLYCPSGVISGNKYELKLIKDKTNDEEEKLKEEDIISISSFDSFDEDKNLDNKKIRPARYFNVDTNISIKCKICGGIGHNKKNCPNYDVKFCQRCIQTGHEDKNCTLKKCFKCNRIWHQTFNCLVNESDLIICDRCSNIGHKSDECLVNPLENSPIYLKFNNLSCFICGSYDHVLCNLSNRELPIIEKEANEICENKDTDNNYTIVEDYDDYDYDFSGKIIKDNIAINKQKFENVLFCSFCGGTHRNEECIDKEKFKNKYDERRQNLANKIIEKRKEINGNKLLFTLNLEDEIIFNFDRDDNKKMIALDEDKENEGEVDNINIFDINNTFNFIKEKSNSNKNCKKSKKSCKSKDSESEPKNQQKINGRKKSKFNNHRVYFKGKNKK